MSLETELRYSEYKERVAAVLRTSKALRRAAIRFGIRAVRYHAETGEYAAQQQCKATIHMIFTHRNHEVTPCK